MPTLLQLTCLLTCLLFSFVSPVASILDSALPIWHPDNTTLKFAYFRSPEFTLPSSSISNILLEATAIASPNVGGQGTQQSKLLCAYKLFVNGILVTAGPGHNNVLTHQAVNTLTTATLEPYFRPAPATNVLAVASYFNRQWKTTIDADVNPGIALTLSFTTSSGTVMNVSTSTTWTAWNADSYHNPDGDNGNGAWYHLPNEDLNAKQRPVGWNSPGFNPATSPAPAWVQAVPATPFVLPLYDEPAPPPAALWRRPCNITSLANEGTSCGTGIEQTSVTLSCAIVGGVINQVLFASYGTPSGSCFKNDTNSFVVNASCNAPDSVSVVESYCLNKVSCSIPVSNAIFGGVDPCHLTPKHLSVAVNCSGGGNGGNSTPTTYHYLLDFGQEFMGGLNLSFIGDSIPDGHQVILQLGEELLPSGGVMVPTRADENYTSCWTLSGTSNSSSSSLNGRSSGSANNNNNIGMSHHEFTQFRYAEVHNSPVELTIDTARAWVVQHPFGGTGENPYEFECSHSTPNVQTWTTTTTTSSPSESSSSLQYGFFTSLVETLNAVFNLTAYTAIATSLDINVDSQTRQRDLCHIDALITGLEQYSIFPPGDYAIQKRTFLNAFGNDSGIWGSWTEFKQSGALMAFSHARETGDLSIAQTVWSDDDFSITSDTSSSYNSLQFYAGVRYFNGSGNGLLSYPNNCGGSWACDPLVDWPTTTRDGYVIDGANTDDVIRNSLGAMAIQGLANIATWIGKADAAAKYTMMADSIVATIASTMLRTNTSTGGDGEMYFTDGYGQDHAAIHSTVYAVAAGAVNVAPSNASVAAAVTQYMRRRDVAPSSCMTGRWYIEALYMLGVFVDDAADFALEILSRTTYPGWGYMIEVGATTTLESWRPADKANMDWSHPWCASPAFLIPRSLMGIKPFDNTLAWSRFRVAPMPGNLTYAYAVVPTPLLDVVTAMFTQSAAAQTVSLELTMPSGTSAQVCLPPLHSSFRSRNEGSSSSSSGDELTIDGVAVSTIMWGRMLCAAADVTAAGTHTIVRS